MFDTASVHSISLRTGAVPGPSRPSKGTVLLVDDELAVVRVYARALGAEGYRVLTAGDGEMAEVMFRKCGIDAVVSDISMPGMDGLRLLRAMQGIDRDVPVILATGDPHTKSALQAAEGGALMHLVKPIDLRALSQIVGYAIQLHQRAKTAGDVGAPDVPPTPRSGGDAGLAARFDAALQKLWIAYQPIVHWTTRVAIGHEALVRSDEPSLADPGALFGAAAQQGRTLDLCRAIRRQIAAGMVRAPEGARIFVNVHAAELEDDALYAATEPLRPFADRVVLEIAERDSLARLTSLAGRIEKLRAAGFRIAIDDLGAGYAGLGSFALLKPSVVKLDISLVREIDTSPIKRKIVEAMVGVCRDMVVELVAEGVETEEERHTLGSLGVHLHQGFAYAVPQRGFA